MNRNSEKHDAARAKNKEEQFLLDGQVECLNLLRRLQQLNWEKEMPSGSARLVNITLRSMSGWPEAERLRFSRVLSDWLVTEILGCGLNVKEYEAELASRAEQRAKVKRAKADQQLQRFLGKLNLGQMPNRETEV